jgi:hypothetical protein
MDPSTPATKRRRIEAAAALSRPFKSPLKEPAAGRGVSVDPPPAKGGSINNKRPQHETFQDSGSLISTRLAATNPSAAPRRSYVVSSLSPAKLSKDPEILSLMRTHTQLQGQLKRLSDELEAVEQARRIESESERRNPGREIDSELVELTRKWKEASRKAADELFTIVHDRVNRYATLPPYTMLQRI